MLKFLPPFFASLANLPTSPLSSSGLRAAVEEGESEEGTPAKEGGDESTDSEEGEPAPQPVEEEEEDDPFDDFDDEDFDDDFDDDFEEELEDDYEIEPDDTDVFPPSVDDDED